MLAVGHGSKPIKRSLLANYNASEGGGGAEPSVWARPKHICSMQCA